MLESIKAKKLKEIIKIYEVFYYKIFYLNRSLKIGTILQIKVILKYID